MMENFRRRRKLKKNNRNKTRDWLLGYDEASREAKKKQKQIERMHKAEMLKLEKEYKRSITEIDKRDELRSVKFQEKTQDLNKKIQVYESEIIEVRKYLTEARVNSYKKHLLGEEVLKRVAQLQNDSTQMKKIETEFNSTIEESRKRLERE